jgi:c-di-GMP-binding flagellar brake protein YcgR
MNDVIVSPPPSTSFLTVGHALKLSLTLQHHKAMYGSTLLGWKDHAWLVCEWPAQLGHDAEIPRGTPCTISYLHDGKLIGYRTEVRDLVTSPVPLLFIAFPQKVEEMHLRKHARVSSCEPVLLCHDAGARSGPPLSPSDYAGGMLKDLSAGGCSVALTQRPSWLHPGATIRLEFELPGLGHVTNLTAIVKNADAQADHHLIGFELQFDGMEYIEYRGWGGSVRQAIEQCIRQRRPGNDLFSLDQ